jgi:hypothetical protein
MHATVATHTSNTYQLLDQESVGTADAASAPDVSPVPVLNPRLEATTQVLTLTIQPVKPPCMCHCCIYVIVHALI